MTERVVAGMSERVITGPGMSFDTRSGVRIAAWLFRGIMLYALLGCPDLKGDILHVRFSQGAGGVFPDGLDCRK
jgi:hypothetical protein